MSKTTTAPRTPSSAASKLLALDIVDFRGIRRLRPEDMSLSGDVVFIYGPNGIGKTSIADAVEWVITGQVRRLDQRSVSPGRNAPDPIVNVFSDTGETRVSCHLDSRASITRIRRGRTTKRTIGTSTAPDDRAVIDHVVGTKAPSAESRLVISRLRDLFRGSHMLAQHDIRQFLEGMKPEERFDILTNMIGAEEFVRFREKVGAVLRILRSNAEISAKRCSDLSREIEEFRKKRQDRQEEFEKLSRAVTAGKTPEDVASELLQGLATCQCTIDQQAVSRAGEESLGRRLELIAILADSVIRAKRRALRTYSYGLIAWSRSGRGTSSHEGSART